MTEQKPLLQLNKLAVAYGGIQAVKAIDAHVNQGELVCLIGANGAGKTTTLKGVCGMLPIKSGTIHYDGRNITGHPPFELVRSGLAMVPEGRGVFGGLTIEENLAMGAYVRHDREGVKADVERVFTLFPRLKERRRQTAGTLSGGEQQMLAMGRALMSKPRLLLLDEPSMGLAPLMVEKVFETALATLAVDFALNLIPGGGVVLAQIAVPLAACGLLYGSLAADRGGRPRLGDFIAIAGASAGALIAVIASSLIVFAAQALTAYAI